MPGVYPGGNRVIWGLENKIGALCVAVDRAERDLRFPRQGWTSSSSAAPLGPEGQSGQPSLLARFLGPRPPLFIRGFPTQRDQTIRVRTVAVGRATEQGRRVLPHRARILPPLFVVPRLWWSYDGINDLSCTLVPEITGFARIWSSCCGGGAGVPVVAGVPIRLVLEPQLSICNALAPGDPFECQVDLSLDPLPSALIGAPVPRPLQIELARQPRPQKPSSRRVKP